MDKNAIKKFAVWARTELIARVSLKSVEYGITEGNIEEANVDSVGGKVLTADEKKQRQALIAEINDKGYKQVMEEVAYTWFNRFIALRFMEVNNYLPSHIRVFSDASGAFKPEILNDGLHLDLPGLDSGKVAEYIESNDSEALYRYLLLTQCNALNSALPVMFERMGGYTEMMLPNNILRQDSVLGHMVSDIPEEDWQDAVQIIGWLYQYYNTELKDDTFAQLKKNVKITKERIPAATQLFTPDWIVRYMVENSLGRLWLEGHPNAELHDGWKYYLDEAEQEPEVETQLAKLREEYKTIKPEEIKVIDPCMGSGHILVYAFDVLVQIYKDAGYSERSIPELILQNNLYGLDIDDRAYQLAYFAVMMRAWHYNHRILRKHIEPHLCAIQESNGLSKWSDDAMDMSGNQLNLENQFIELADYLIDTFQDAKEYGSILTVKEANYDGLLDYIEEIQQHGASDLAVSAWIGEIADRMPALIKQAKIMSAKYDVCVTNPPYMGGHGMSKKLSAFLKKEYIGFQTDLFSSCIFHFFTLTNRIGYLGFLSPYVWMFIQSYQALRSEIIDTKTIMTLIQFEYSAFEEATVPICSFILRNTHYNQNSVYLRLTDFRGGMEVQRIKALEGISTHNKQIYHMTTSQTFKDIPGTPIAYALPYAMRRTFADPNIFLSNIAELKAGLSTADNPRFQRYWQEINAEKIGYGYHSIEETMDSIHKWFPCHSGGIFRKWFPVKELVINWEHNGKELRNKKGAALRNQAYYFKEGFTWNKLSSSNFATRYRPIGYIFDDTSRTGYIKNAEYNLFTVIGFMCSNVCFSYLEHLNPTMSFTNNDLERLPILCKSDKQVSDLVKHNIRISEEDIDAFETSWDFQRHPLLPTTVGQSVADYYAAFQSDCKERFLTLKSNEEELNRIFIDIYGLADELTPDVADKDVTVARIYDTKDDIPDSMKGNNYVLTKSDVVKSLLSYAVGCMFGRYSLDVPGLAYAGGGFDWSKYPTFRPDEDDIIPICDDEYFEDDIVDRFCTWLRTVYGEAHYQENLQFISDALGGKGSPLENIRSYFLNDFYKDHCKTYKKRPIYWLFDAGRKNSFKALVYIHRYDRDTIARMRTGYVYKQQELYKTRIETYKKRVDTAATQADKNKYKKELKRLQDQFDEIHAYEEKIHHYADLRQEIDLDDGVKHNYALFADVLAKIK